MKGARCVRSEWNMDFNITINFPAVDVSTIGAGGGSIARVDAGGSLRVGPDSAGATPGPACYGKGGTAATVTDANLLLGRLDPDTRLAGKVALASRSCGEGDRPDCDATRHVRHDAAIGILRIMRSNMANGIRLLSIKRGHDPRLFSLVAFGGAGPLHAIELAREIGIPEVIIPYYPGLRLRARQSLCRGAARLRAIAVRDQFAHTI